MLSILHDPMKTAVGSLVGSDGLAAYSSRNCQYNWTNIYDVVY